MYFNIDMAKPQSVFPYIRSVSLTKIIEKDNIFLIISLPKYRGEVKDLKA